MTYSHQVKQEKKSIDAEEFYSQDENGNDTSEWRCHPRQRDYVRRANDKGFQKRMSVYHPDHHEVKGVICGCDIVDKVTGEVYKKGTKIKCDGHTTAYYYHNLNTDLKPTKYNITYHTIHTEGQLDMSYDVYDNSDAAEKANDRLDSAARSVLHPKGIHITNKKVRSVTAVEYAACTLYPDKHFRGSGQNARECTLRLDDVASGFVWVQNVVSSKNFCDQVKLSAPLLCNYIVAYEYYYLQGDVDAIERLKEFILRVSDDERLGKFEGKYDACTFFLREWTKPTEQIINFKKTLNMGEDSKRGQAFVLKMIDEYVKQTRRINMCSSKDLTNYFDNWQRKFAGVTHILNQIEKPLDITKIEFTQTNQQDPEMRGVNPLVPIQ